MIVSENRRKSPETPGEKALEGEGWEGGREAAENGEAERRNSMVRCGLPPVDLESFLPCPSTSFPLMGEGR